MNIPKWNDAQRYSRALIQIRTGRSRVPFLQGQLLAIRLYREWVK